MQDRIPWMRRLAQKDDERDGIELFGALVEYLDQLCGPDLPDRSFPAGQQERMGAMITGIRAGAAVGSPSRRQDHQGAGPEDVRRLDRPVNASVTLAEGRELAARLFNDGDWRAELGDAIKGLYGYLDQVHGGSFTELLNSAERRRVAAALASSAASGCTPGGDQPPRMSPRSKLTGSSSCS